MKKIVGKEYFRYSPHVRLTQSFRFFYLCGHLNTLVYSVEIENEWTLHQRVLRPVRTFATAPGPMKVYDSPRSDVSVCALIGLMDNLSIPCEM